MCDYNKLSQFNLLPHLCRRAVGCEVAQTNNISVKDSHGVKLLGNDLEHKIFIKISKGDENFEI